MQLIQNIFKGVQTTPLCGYNMCYQNYHKIKLRICFPDIHSKQFKGC